MDSEPQRPARTVLGRVVVGLCHSSGELPRADWVLIRAAGGVVIAQSRLVLVGPFMKIHEEPEVYTVRGSPRRVLGNDWPYDYVMRMEKVQTDPLPSMHKTRNFFGGIR